MSRSDGADQLPTVLMVGPDVGAIGGMGSVARTLATSADARGHHHVELLGSGGGRGPSGWIAWPGALARAASMPADVMHLHVADNGSTWRKASFAAVARARGIPYVVHLHGAGYVEFLDSLPPRRLAVVRNFFRHAARVITLGDFWRDLVISRLGTDPSRTLVVANGVEEIPSQDPTTTIVHLGEVTRRKGVDVLLVAASRVLPDHPEWRLELVGPTPEQDLVEQAEALGRALDGRVEVIGPRYGEDRLPHLAGAGVFVLASRHEGLPMAMLEAMSASLPVVVTPVGAIGEVVTDDLDALLVPPADADALASALDRLLDDPVLRTRLGAAAHETWRRRFSSDAMLDGVEASWDAALGRLDPVPRQGSGSPATVTVIIPTIGRDSLRAAVDSARSQATDDLRVQVVVVNDSGAPLDRDLGEGVRVVDTPGRSGVSAARNLGLASVDTDFFALLDDDDLQRPGHLRAAIDTLNASGTHVYFCRGLVHYGTDRSRIEPAERLGDLTLREYLMGLSNWRSRSRRVLTSTVVGRREQARHRFDETMIASEDTWWLLSLEHAGACVVDSPFLGIDMFADEQREEQREEQRRAAMSDPHALDRRLASIDPGIVPGYIVGRPGRAAARAGDPVGVLRAAAEARRAGGTSALVAPIVVELAAAVALGAARRGRDVARRIRRR